MVSLKGVQIMLRWILWQSLQRLPIIIRNVLLTWVYLLLCRANDPGSVTLPVVHYIDHYIKGEIRGTDKDGNQMLFVKEKAKAHLPPLVENWRLRQKKRRQREDIEKKKNKENDLILLIQWFQVSGLLATVYLQSRGKKKILFLSKSRKKM